MRCKNVVQFFERVSILSRARISPVPPAYACVYPPGAYARVNVLIPCVRIRVCTRECLRVLSLGNTGGGLFSGLFGRALSICFVLDFIT